MSSEPDSKTLCVICKRRSVEPAHKPFCSKRCADVDLNRWFNESYAVPAEEPLSEETLQEEEADGLPSRLH
jgi:endogenous inhibitor of DNA gyrase (YacG/DUF329 family)